MKNILIFFFLLSFFGCTKTPPEEDKKIEKVQTQDIYNTDKIKATSEPIKLW